jgi:type I restriction enzyme S subunit
MNRADRVYAIGRGLAAIQSDDNADQNYIFYALQDRLVRLLERTTGSVFPNVSRADISSLPVSWPDRPARMAISSVLAALDKKIESNRRSIRFVSEVISTSWLQRFGAPNDRDWPKIPIGEIADIVGGSTPSTTFQDYWGGTIAWATPRDLSHLPSVALLDTERHLTELGLGQISSGLLPAGTVLLSSRAPIGYLAITEVPVAVNQGFIALIPGARASNVYLWQWLQNHSEDVNARANGTTFLEVSKANFRPLPIALPPEDLMRKWTVSATQQFRLIVAKERESLILTELRNFILPKLFSGELRVCNAESLVEDVL